MRKFTVPALLIAAALPLAACGGTTSASSVAADCKPVVANVKTAQQGKLTAAVQEYPPYVSMKGGSVSGVDGEVIKRIAKDLCLQPDVKVQTPTAVIESVKNGSVDLTAGNWYINDERQSLFAVSKPVYLDKMALVTTNGADTLDGISSSSVGTVQGYLWVGDLQKALGSDKVKLYQSEDAVFQDVKNGRIAAGVITYGEGSYLLKNASNDKLKVTEMKPDERVQASVGAARTAVLVNKNEAPLRDAIDQVVANMRQDGSLAKALTDNGLPASAATPPAS